MAKKPSNAQSIIGEIRNMQYRPIYFLTGEESYYIDLITDTVLSSVLSEEEKEFDQCILYGKDLSVEQVISTARRYPMLGKYQVVVIREAQQIKDFEDKFGVYVQNPMPSTILVINYKYKRLDRRKKLAGLLDKQDCLFEFEKMYDNQLPAWIENYTRQMGYSIDAKTSQLLADFLGNDLERIAGELKKLSIVMPKGGDTQITADLVEKNIGISKDYNNFELIDALRRKDIVKAHRIAIHFANNPKDNPLVVTLTVLFDFFSKLMIYHYLADKSPSSAAAALSVNPYFVKDYEAGAKQYPAVKAMRNITLIRSYDAKAKGYQQTASKDGALLKELLCLLMA